MIQNQHFFSQYDDREGSPSKSRKSRYKTLINERADLDTVIFCKLNQHNTDHTRQYLDLQFVHPNNLIQVVNIICR